MKQTNVEVEFVVKKRPKERPTFIMVKRKIKVIYEMTQDEMNQALQQFQLQMNYEDNQM